MVHAIAGTNGHSFKVFSNQREISFHELPVYNDGLGRAKRVALTPIAVVCDLTVIGGYLLLWFWAGGGLADVH